MNARTIQTVPLFACLLMLLNVAAMAQDGGRDLALSAGMELTSGTYGGDVDIEDTYLPLTATVSFGRTAFRLTVPYLSVTAPAGTVFDPDGIPIPGSGDLVTESGLGDVIGSVTFHDVFSNDRAGFAMDLTGKVKFATADEDKGLGTGENDYSAQADFYKFMDKVTLIGSLGYKFRGDTADTDLDNVMMASLGSTIRFTPKVKGGLFLDYRESSVSGSDDISELTAFVSRQISDVWRVQLYALTGFTDSSPDWGGGIQIKALLGQ